MTYSRQSEFEMLLKEHYPGFYTVHSLKDNVYFVMSKRGGRKLGKRMPSREEAIISAVEEITQ